MLPSAAEAKAPANAGVSSCPPGERRRAKRAGKMRAPGLFEPEGHGVGQKLPIVLKRALRGIQRIQGRPSAMRM